MVRHKYELKVKFLIKTEKNVSTYTSWYFRLREEFPNNSSKRLPRSELRVSEQSPVPGPCPDTPCGPALVLLLRIDTFRDFCMAVLLLRLMLFQNNRSLLGSYSS